MSGQNELQPKSVSITSEIETSAQDLEPDMLNHSEADRFLGILEPAGNFTFMTFGEGGKRATPGLTQTWHGQFKDYVTDLSAANLYYGAGVFVTVNETDLTGRSADNILRVRAVFVDLDGADLQPVMEWELLPHIVVESSPGKWHAYWLVNDLARSKFSIVQKSLAMRFGGDRKVCDLPRLMRVPGFFHRRLRLDAFSPFVSV